MLCCIILFYIFIWIFFRLSSLSFMISIERHFFEVLADSILPPERQFIEETFSNENIYSVDASDRRRQAECGVAQVSLTGGWLRLNTDPPELY